MERTLVLQSKIEASRNYYKFSGQDNNVIVNLYIAKKEFGEVIPQEIFVKITDIKQEG